MPLSGFMPLRLQMRCLATSAVRHTAKVVVLLPFVAITLGFALTFWCQASGAVDVGWRDKFFDTIGCSCVVALVLGPVRSQELFWQPHVQRRLVSARVTPQVLLSGD
jgi:hypothetical protein